MAKVSFSIPPDPDFTEMSVPELEAYINDLDTPIGNIRSSQARAHAVLERKLQQERNREIAARPSNFPPSQKLG